MVKEKYDIIGVLSGNYVHTDPRIRKALELWYQGKGNEFIFNGFNTKEKHDPKFEGDWPNDPRLKPFIDEIEQIHPIIIYARNTCETAYKQKEKAKEYGFKKFNNVTSDFHVKRCKHIFRKFFDPYSNEFVGVPTARNLKELHKLKLHEIIQEWLCHYYFYGLKRGDDPKKIRYIYNSRKEKIKGLISKISKYFAKFSPKNL